MMTVSKAYQILKQEGYIVTDRRKGAVVAGAPASRISEETLRELRLKISELRLAGMKKEEILAMIEKIYAEGNK